MAVRGFGLAIAIAAALSAFAPAVQARALDPGLGSVAASDLRVSSVAPAAAVDAISGVDTYPGTWFWNPQMDNVGTGDLASPTISLNGVGSQWTQPISPPLPPFPITETDQTFPVGSNFPFGSQFSDLQPLPLGFQFGFHGPATTGYDASRTLTSPGSDLVPSGGALQTWLVSMTLRDPSLTGSQIIVQVDPTDVGASVVSGSVITPTLDAGETPVFFDTSDGALAWSITGAVVGKTYTLSLQIDVPNGGGPFVYKPGVYFQASPPEQASTYSVGTSTSIADDVLGGTFTYSVGSTVNWATDVGASFDANLEQFGPNAVDSTPPVLVFQGNQGSYGILDTVDITCTASDPSPGSGLAHDPCAGFAIDGPAWSFAPGVNTLPVPGLVATDNAGNSSAPASTSFTVTVTPGDLCLLTVRFVQGSSKYQRLSPAQKRAVDALTNAACAVVRSVVPRLNAAQKAVFVRGYVQTVQGLAATGWLSGSQAATLTSFAHAL